MGAKKKIKTETKTPVDATAAKIDELIAKSAKGAEPRPARARR